MNDEHNLTPLPKLRQALVHAAARAEAPAPVPRSRRRLWLAIAGAVAAIAAALGAALLSPSPATAGVNISFRDGLVHVSLDAVATTPDEVTDALQDHNLPITVMPQPVGPSRVGQFLRATNADESGYALVFPQTGPHSAGSALEITFELDVRPTQIYLGVPANGEGYFTPSDAFGEGEPLECRTDVLGQRYENVQWPTTPALLYSPDGPVHPENATGLYVTSVGALSPTRFAVTLGPTPDTRPLDPGLNVGTIGCPIDR